MSHDLQIRPLKGSPSFGNRYDLVIASEVIEHVRRPEQFVQTLARLMDQAPCNSVVARVSESEREAPAVAVGGHGEVSGGGSLLILSTLNRTPESFAVAIVGAEYVTGMVPRGTHEWDRFITPHELVLMADQVCA